MSCPCGHHTHFVQLVNYSETGVLMVTVESRGHHCKQQRAVAFLKVLVRCCSELPPPFFSFFFLRVSACMCVCVCVCENVHLIFWRHPPAYRPLVHTEASSDCGCCKCAHLIQCLQTLVCFRHGTWQPGTVKRRPSQDKWTCPVVCCALRGLVAAFVFIFEWDMLFSAS